MSPPKFTELNDLSCKDIGGKIIFATDDWFAGMYVTDRIQRSLLSSSTCNLTPLPSWQACAF